VIITFNEAISASTFVYTVAPDPGGWSEVWGGGTAVLPGGTVVTLTHNPFDYQTTYIVNVSAAKDGASNSPKSPVEWTFTTLNAPDTAQPTVTAFSPPDAAQDVAVDAAVIITFSKAINTTTFAYAVTPDPLGWDETWSDNDVVVTLSHSPFDHWTTYTISVTAAADLAGNPLSDAPYVWRFATLPQRVYLPLVLKNH